MTNLYFFHLHACYSIFQNFFCAGIQFFVVLNSYDIFTYMVYLKDLHIFTCKNCGEKYLAVADMDYCTAPECLDEREKAKRRTKRQNRKYNPFVRPLDNFHEYARGRKREMTLAGATEGDHPKYCVNLRYGVE